MCVFCCLGTGIGEEVLTVSAVDPDENSKLRYSIVEPIVARDKTGSLVTTTTYNYKVKLQHYITVTLCMFSLFK